MATDTPDNLLKNESTPLDSIAKDSEKALAGQAPAPTGGGDALQLQHLDSKVLQALDKKKEVSLDHLPEHERDVIKRQLDTPEVAVSFFKLYRYASRNDWLLVALSAICAILGGAIMPLMTVCFFAPCGVEQSRRSAVVDHEFRSFLASSVVFFKAFSRELCHEKSLIVNWRASRYISFISLLENSS
jgi:ATP-binding cassette, subfamily B (MDR/TAP), member 1